MSFLGPLAKEEVPLALWVWQFCLQPALVTLSQWTAGYAVMSGETTGHVTWTITTRSWTLPVSKPECPRAFWKDLRSSRFLFILLLMCVLKSWWLKSPLNDWMIVQSWPVVEAVLVGSGVADGFTRNRGGVGGLACSRRLPHTYVHLNTNT